MKNKTILWIIFLVVVILTVALFYGCSSCGKREGFEDSTADTTMKKIDEEDKAIAKEKEDKKVKEFAEELKKVLDKPIAEGEEAFEDKKKSKPVAVSVPEKKKAPAGDLKDDEKELFMQITQNLMSGKELEKLIRAGVLTENMIERFLNQIDANNNVDGESIEGFCSGDACYMSL